MDQTLADHYRELDDEELLRLSLEQPRLTQEAAEALGAEISRRGFSRSDAEVVAEADREYGENIDRTRRRSVGFDHAEYTGFYGCWHIEKKGRIELYTATKFFCPFYFPLIPLGTYRIFRKSERSRWDWLFGRDSRIRERIPLDWQQVLWIWCKGALVLYALILLGSYLR